MNDAIKKSYMRFRAEGQEAQFALRHAKLQYRASQDTLIQSLTRKKYGTRQTVIGGVEVSPRGSDQTTVGGVEVTARFQLEPDSDIDIADDSLSFKTAIARGMETKMQRPDHSSVLMDDKTTWATLTDEVTAPFGMAKGPAHLYKQELRKKIVQSMLREMEDRYVLTVKIEWMGYTIAQDNIGGVFMIGDDLTDVATWVEECEVAAVHAARDFLKRAQATLKDAKLDVP